jgi:3-dehydroquinate dehydratase-2
LKKLIIINGPNLNLLGKREPLLYGNESFESYLSSLKQEFDHLELGSVQSNSEEELIHAIHTAEEKGYEGIILNPGAFTHTSIAVGDAVAGVDTPVIEVHISNLAQREGFRGKSFISKYAIGLISGFGLDGYRLALTQFSKPAEQN